MKKLFSVLGVFILFFGLSSFNSLSKLNDVRVGSTFKLQVITTDNYNTIICDNPGTQCANSGVLVINKPKKEK